jgi:hypothetical protein
MRLRVVNTQNFITFLKKLKIIEKSVLLEIGEENTFCKVHTPDKSVMKYSAIPNSEIFEGDIDWTEIGMDRVKIGILDVTKLIESFKHFRAEEDIYFDVNVAEIDGEKIASEINLSSASLNIKIRCADLTLLSYIEDEILSMVHSKEDAIHRFKMYQSDFSSIVSLCSLESDSNELLEFDVYKDKIIAKGNSFDYTLNIGNDEIKVSKETADISIYKNQLGYVDIETGECYVHQNRMIFFSDQSMTSTAVGLVSK